MVYLAYTATSVFIVHDEEMEKYKQHANSPVVLARFPLTDAEAGMTITQLELIYPYHRKQETKNGN